MSIFPAFYLVWLGEYIHWVLVTRNLFYSGNPFSMILAFLGMDGYFNYLVLLQNEIILIDNGSSDQNKEWCCSLADFSVRLSIMLLRRENIPSTLY